MNFMIRALCSLLNLPGKLDCFVKKNLIYKKTNFGVYWRHSSLFGWKISDGSTYFTTKLVCFVFVHFFYLTKVSFFSRNTWRHLTICCKCVLA